MAATHEPLIRQVLATGEAIHDLEFSRSLSAASRDQRHWLVSYFRVDGGSSEHAGVGALAVDITARKLLEQTQQDFLDGVSHDLKSPLASIRFSVQMLAEEPALREERLQDLLASLVDSTDRTLAFIDDFLNRNAAASMVALDSFKPFALRELLRNVVTTYDHYGSEKKIRVEMNSSEPMEAFGDPLAVEHVLENLLSNALKFAPRGSRVQVQLEQGRPGPARVRVLDRSPGIDEVDRKRLFQRYVRLSARPTSGESSTGLGLSIAKQLADAMHGTLAYEPRPGGGSIFVFDMPTRPVS